MRDVVLAAALAAVSLVMLTWGYARAETQALVSEINKARNASYQQVAESNNIPPDEVAKMAGQKLVARAKPGEYVQGINGKWLRKE